MNVPRPYLGFPSSLVDLSPDAIPYSEGRLSTRLDTLAVPIPNAHRNTVLFRDISGDIGTQYFDSNKDSSFPV